MKFYNFSKYSFIAGVFLLLLTPLVLFSELLYPFTTSKAFYFRIVIELILPFYCYLVFYNKSLRPNLKNPVSVFVVLFLLISFLASVFGLDFSRSFWGTFERMDGVFILTHFSLLYFYVLLLGRLSGQVLEKFFKAFVWVAAILSINGIIGFLGGPTLTPDFSLPTRASSTFGNPIYFASFLVLPMLISVFFAFQSENKKSMVLYFVLSALQLTGIILSASRGVFVGLVAALGFFGVIFLFLQKDSRARKIASGGVFFIVLLVVLLYVFSSRLPLGSVVKRIFTLQDSNTQSRLIQWQTGLKGVKDYAFLGTGPNNYFVISNKYYNPEIFQYDHGWFDKPHNYQLEILTTTGVSGFLAYLALVMSVFYALYRSFKRGLLTLLESCVLAGAYMAYQIQNLFVFDTVTASLAVYAFFGLVGFFGEEALEIQVKNNKQANIGTRYTHLFIWLGLPVMLYIVYATNLVGYKIAKALNIAKLFQTKDFDVAKSLYDQTEQSPFNFYWKDFSYEYSNFAANWSNRKQNPEQLEKSKAMMEQAIKISKIAVEKHPLDPTMQLKLANAYFARSHIENSGFNQQAYDIGLMAVKLAPNKHEAKLFLARVAVEGKKPELAEVWLKEILADYPDLHDARWQLGSIYFFFEKRAEAEKLAEEALLKGYKLERIKQGDWLLTSYYESKKPEKALEFLFSQASEFSGDPDYFARLADAYMKSGRFKEAREMALKVLELDPASKPDVEAFLSGLPK